MLGNNHRMRFAGTVDVAPNHAHVGGLGVGLRQVTVVLERLKLEKNKTLSRLALNCIV